MGIICIFMLALFEILLVLSVPAIGNHHGTSMTNACAATSAFSAGANTLQSSPGNLNGMVNCRRKWSGKKRKLCINKPNACKAFSHSHVCCFNRFCRDTSSNPFNCGFCGHACKHGMRCCGGVCVDSANDKSHCGKCWNVCAPDENCVFGLCGYG